MSSTRHTNDRTRTARARERRPGRIKAIALLSLATTTALVAVVGCSSTKAGHSSSAPGGQTSTGNVVAGAASAPTTNEATVGNVKPCDLLTVDEIKTATGVAAQAGKSEDDDNSACKWVLDSQDGGQSTVSVDLIEADLYPGLAPSTAVKVSGVGDEALWAAGLWTLYVHTGQRVFSVQVVLLRVNQQPIAQTLARNVLAHLS